MNWPAPVPNSHYCVQIPAKTLQILACAARLFWVGSLYMAGISENVELLSQPRNRNQFLDMQERAPALASPGLCCFSDYKLIDLFSSEKAA